MRRVAGGPAVAVLFPGEYPASTLLSDANHWCSVYRHLLTEKEVSLIEVGDAIARRSTADTTLLERQARLQRQAAGHRLRLSYWAPRRDQLVRAQRDRLCP